MIQIDLSKSAPGLSFVVRHRDMQCVATAIHAIALCAGGISQLFQQTTSHPLLCLMMFGGPVEVLNRLARAGARWFPGQRKTIVEESCLVRISIQMRPSLNASKAGSQAPSFDPLKPG